MPVDMIPYGKDWDPFSRTIRFVRARSQCECHGQCGLHGGTRLGLRCRERHHTPAIFAKGRIKLSVAHLCRCTPPCRDPNHVIAACQRCHLRIDRYKHARTRHDPPGGPPA